MWMWIMIHDDNPLEWAVYPICRQTQVKLIEWRTGLHQLSYLSWAPLCSTPVRALAPSKHQPYHLPMPNWIIEYWKWWQEYGTRDNPSETPGNSSPSDTISLSPRRHSSGYISKKFAMGMSGSFHCHIWPPRDVKVSGIHVHLTTIFTSIPIEYVIVDQYGSMRLAHVA